MLNESGLETNLDHHVRELGLQEIGKPKYLLWTCKEFD